MAKQGSSPNQDQIMDRIAKLLAMAESSNPNEAAIALERAQRLMREHQLSSDDISLHAISEQTENVPSMLRDRHLYTTLSQMIVRAFGITCFYTFRNSTINAITYVGPTDRVQSASYTFTVLARQAAQLKKDFVIQQKTQLRSELFDTYNFSDIYYDEPNLSTVWNDFPVIKREHTAIIRRNTKAYIHGWLYAIYEKVTEFATTEEENRLIENFMEQNHSDITTMRKGRRTFYNQEQMDSFQQGEKDAAETSLYHGVNTSFKALHLGYKG